MWSVVDPNVVMRLIPVLTTYKTRHTIQSALQYVFSKTVALLSKVLQQQMIHCSNIMLDIVQYVR